MNANEARRVAFSFNTFKSKTIIQDIYARIEEASKAGKFDIYYNSVIPTDVKLQLESDGFTIYSDSRDGTDSHTISW